MKKNRWSNYSFKNGQVLKNRVVVPPMASQTADEAGFATYETFQHYKNLALSGAGLIFVEYSHIHQSGKGESNQLGADSDAKTPGLSKISSIIKNSGALSGLQLVHVGGKTSSALTGQLLLGASAVSVPVKGQNLEKPVAMNEKQIKEMISWYKASAQRAYQAGFDFVELHAAHGYGLNQWLSPMTNYRHDAYGGSQQKRARVLYEIVKSIKAEFPNKLLAVRLPAEDHFTNGLSFKQMVMTIKDLELLKVDLIDVSSGIGGWRRPKGRLGQGYLLEEAQKVKAISNLPVIGVGGIYEGAFIDEALEAEVVDFTAVGRAILKGPAAWREQNLECGKILCEAV